MYIKEITNFNLPVVLGYQGENRAREFDFNISDWVEEFGDGTPNITVLRPHESLPYIALTEFEENKVKWIVTESDTQLKGNGMIQLSYVVNDSLVKEVRIATVILEAIETPEEVPDPWLSWVNQVLMAASSAAEDARNEVLGRFNTDVVKEITTQTTANVVKLLLDKFNITQQQEFQTELTLPTASETSAGMMTSQQVAQLMSAITSDGGDIFGALTVHSQGAENGISVKDDESGWIANLYATNLDFSNSTETDPIGTVAGLAEPSYDDEATNKKYVDDKHKTITDVIPQGTNEDNPLTNKDFVNSSIATNTANYISKDGLPFNSLDELKAYSGTITNNDYAFVVGVDADQNTVYTRYKYSEENDEWAEEYKLNNSSFTAEQWQAISSGITTALVTNYNSHIQNGTIHITAAERTRWNNKVSKTGDSMTGQLDLAGAESTTSRIRFSDKTTNSYITKANNTGDRYLAIAVTPDANIVKANSLLFRNGRLEHGTDLFYDLGTATSKFKTLHVGTAKVYNTPTDTVDATNKQYVDSLIGKITQVKIAPTTTIALLPDVKTVITEPVQQTEFTFGASLGGYWNEWSVLFTTDDVDAFVDVTFPSNVVWSVAEPVFEPNHTYYLSFIASGDKYMGIWSEV